MKCCSLVPEDTQRDDKDRGLYTPLIVRRPLRVETLCNLGTAARFRLVGSGLTKQNYCTLPIGLCNSLKRKAKTAKLRP